MSLKILQTIGSSSFSRQDSLALDNNDIRVCMDADRWILKSEAKIAAIDEWYARWEAIAGEYLKVETCAVHRAGNELRSPSVLHPANTHSFSMLWTLKVNANLAKLTISNLNLRGVKHLDDLSPSRKECLLSSGERMFLEDGVRSHVDPSPAVRWARALCRICVQDIQVGAIKFVGE